MPQRSTSQPPSEPIGTVHEAIGTVKWYKDEKGYGAIACVETAPWDIWFHFCMLERPANGTGFRTIEPGTPVEVDFRRADQESFRYVAHAVRRKKS